MSKSKIFFWLSLSFIGGVFGASFLYPKVFSEYFIFLILAVGIIWIILFYENKPVMTAGFCLVFFVFGAYLTTLKLNNLKNTDMDGKNFSGEVRIVKEPEQKDKYQKIIISPIVQTSDVPNAFGHPMSKSRQAPKILLNVFDMTEYAYGDMLKVDCVLKIPENFTPDFDYKMYLAKDGIFYECQKPKVEKLGRNEGSLVYSIILKIKNKLNDNITRFIPSPEAGLLSGLILGGNGLLSKTYQEYFSRTGLTHIVAVSGYNVTIVAEYLMLLGIFLGLWRPQAFWFAVFGIIIFVLMTGFPSSAVRAGVMGILLIWAMKNGRLANAGNAILCSAVIMLAINPLLLRWDIGFQLSFLATLGIVYLYPVFQNYFARIVESKNVLISGALEIFLLTMSAQIFVLPIILFNFGNLSLISPLANLLVLPIIPLTMLLGFVAVMLGFIFTPLATVASWLAYLPLRYETVVIRYLAGFHYSSVEVRLAWWGVAVWYIILLVTIRYFNAKAKDNL